MTPRLRPEDLDRSPYRELLPTLALQWVRAELPALGLSYADYTTAIRTLLLTTQNVERTTDIVQAVLSQATLLHKTSVWVEQELKFEGMIEGADRADFLLFELQQADTIDDALLDSYNERITRFSSPDA